MLGLAFKPDTDDVRESPALDVIRGLVSAGVTVRAHDPVAIENARALVPGVEYQEDPYAAAAGAHVLIVATDWAAYRDLDWREIRARMLGPAIVDARNMLDPVLLTQLGFAYSSLGQNARVDASGVAQPTNTMVTTV